MCRSLLMILMLSMRHSVVKAIRQRRASGVLVMASP